MKKAKRFLSVCMIFILLISLISTNASAAVAQKWRRVISEFQTISEAKSRDYPDYTKVLQMCLVSLGEPYYSLVGGSRAVDGIYGTKTGDAVKRYQQSKSLQADRICGPNTWYALANELDDEPNANGYTYFSKNGDNIMMVTSSNPYKFRYYMLVNGNPMLSDIFHTSIA